MNISKVKIHTKQSKVTSIDTLLETLELAISTHTGTYIIHKPDIFSCTQVIHSVMNSYTGYLFIHIQPHVILICKPLPPTPCCTVKQLGQSTLLFCRYVKAVCHNIPNV